MHALKISSESKKLFKVRRLNIVWLFIPLVMLLLLASVILFDNNRIVADPISFSLPTLPKQLDGFTILQLSDIRDKRFGEDGAQLRKAISGKRYDVVCITGDLMDDDGDSTGFFQALEYFHKNNKPVYFITGESDPATYGIQKDGSFGENEWFSKAKALGAVHLDVPIALSAGERKLWLTPASPLLLDVESAIASLEARMEEEGQIQGASQQAIIHQRSRYQLFAQQQAVRGQSDLTVMLSHEPCLNAQMQSETSNQIFAQSDLILAGHYLGGQFRMFGRAVYVDNPRFPKGGWLPSDIYLTGLNQINGKWQYVSSGLGTRTKPPFRFRTFNPPQISFITLTRRVSA